MAAGDGKEAWEKGQLRHELKQGDWLTAGSETERKSHDRRPIGGLQRLRRFFWGEQQEGEDLLF